MGNLGTRYARGLGVTVDYEVARARYEKSAALGDSRSLANLGHVYPVGQVGQEGIVPDSGKLMEGVLPPSHRSIMTRGPSGRALVCVQPRSSVAGRSRRRSR